MKRTRIIGAVLAVAAAACVVPAGADEEPAPGVAGLSWLAGTWEGTAGNATWHAVYTSPKGAEVLSVTKQIVDGKSVFFDFERFFEKDGKTILVPFPAGKASKEFPLVELDGKARKAVFANPAHDFPRRFTYHRSADDTLAILLEGEQGGKPARIQLELKRLP